MRPAPVRTYSLYPVGAKGKGNSEVQNNMIRKMKDRGISLLKPAVSPAAGMTSAYHDIRNIVLGGWALTLIIIGLL